MSDKHLSTQFDAELTGVSTRVLEMGGLVESQVSRAIASMTTFDGEGAAAVLREEIRVNRMEVEVDRELSAIIARRQPTARDLRLLSPVVRFTAGGFALSDKFADAFLDRPRLRLFFRSLLIRAGFSLGGRICAILGRRGRRGHIMRRERHFRRSNGGFGFQG